MLQNVVEGFVAAGVGVRVASWQNTLMFQLPGWAQCTRCGAFAPAERVTPAGCPECTAAIANIGKPSKTAAPAVAKIGNPPTVTESVAANIGNPTEVPA